MVVTFAYVQKKLQPQQFSQTCSFIPHLPTINCLYFASNTDPPFLAPLFNRNQFDCPTAYTLIDSWFIMTRAQQTLSVLLLVSSVCSIGAVDYVE